MINYSIFYKLTNRNDFIQWFTQTVPKLRTRARARAVAPKLWLREHARSAFTAGLTHAHTNKKAHKHTFGFFFSQSPNQVANIHNGGESSPTQTARSKRPLRAHLDARSHSIGALRRCYRRRHVPVSRFIRWAETRHRGPTGVRKRRRSAIGQQNNHHNIWTGVTLHVCRGASADTSVLLIRARKGRTRERRPERSCSGSPRRFPGARSSMQPAAARRPPNPAASSTRLRPTTSGQPFQVKIKCVHIRSKLAAR